jgi:hypothetical protein
VRRDTKPYEGLGITEIADHYDAVIRAPTARRSWAPFGGLVTQIRSTRPGAAGVHPPRAAKGDLALPLSTLRVTRRC